MIDIEDYNVQVCRTLYIVNTLCISMTKEQEEQRVLQLIAKIEARKAEQKIMKSLDESIERALSH